jgi:CRP-like cAMP-binding protein
MENFMNKTIALKNSPLFSSLRPPELRSLETAAEWVDVPQDEVVLREGELTTELYLVVGGRAQAVARDERGGRVTLSIFKTGDHFGEMSFIDGQPRSATVEALTPLRLLRIPRPAFTRVIRENPDISFVLMRGLSAKIRRATRQMEDLVFIVSHEELQNAHLETIRRLAMAAEFKDDNTGTHLERVSRYSETLAQGAGLSDQMVADIRHAAPMHDIGKIGIPERILLKPGRLTADELRVMQAHPTIGGRILANPGSGLMRRAREIALGHHERFDGTGYPDGEQGEDIPLSARIVALADVFDALTTARPYKAAFPPERAAELIHRERRRHFDPVLVDLFEAHFETFSNLAEMLRDQVTPHA